MLSATDKKIIKKKLVQLQKFNNALEAACDRDKHFPFFSPVLHSYDNANTTKAGFRILGCSMLNYLKNHPYILKESDLRIINDHTVISLKDHKPVDHDIFTDLVGDLYVKYHEKIYGLPF